MERKSDKVRRLVSSGQYKEALCIAKDFRLGITKAESSAMTLAYECMVHGRFYEQLGYDLKQKVAEGVETLKRLYGRSEENDLHKQILEPGTENREVHGRWNNEGGSEVPASV